jgi:hypothetical protein
MRPVVAVATLVLIGLTRLTAGTGVARESVPESPAEPITHRWQVDIEAGRAYPASNDVRIPGEGGTDFSLTDDLVSKEDWVGRIQLAYQLSERHRILALGAPLTITSTGQFDEPVDFNGETFAPGTDIVARYRFNSYRLTWRYGIDPTGDFRWGLGLTGKIRDAEIELAGGGVASSKSNVGFVPLINFNVDARLTGAWWLTVEGDALAAPQGRAEDVFAGVRHDFDEQSSIRLGYRLLEGGADNDEVYNFAWINYLVGAIAVRF